MFDYLIDKLKTIIPSLDLINSSNAKELSLNVLDAIKTKLELNTEIDVYIRDIMWVEKDRVTDRTTLIPFVSTDDFPEHSRMRHQANDTPIYPNGAAENGRGTWLWALAFDQKRNIWIDDIQSKKCIKGDSNEASNINTLTSNYIMVTDELVNNAQLDIPIPDGAIIYKKTNSIIVIPLIYKNPVNSKVQVTQVGILSLESRKGNFTKEIFDGLRIIGDLLAALIWKVYADKYMKQETDNIVKSFRRNVRLWENNERQKNSSNIITEHKYFKLLDSPDISNSDIFIAMPFRDSFVSFYDTCIREVIDDLGYSVIKGDDPSRSMNIMNQVWTAIHLSKVIIVDCTGKNPNVFYELGIAHALDKPVILITQDKEDIPFDIRHLRYIEYNTEYHKAKAFQVQLSNFIREEMKSIKG
ncbi:MAG: hypothetical protein AAFO82_08925 [Bacteroidota bacterium]